MGFAVALGSDVAIAICIPIAIAFPITIAIAIAIQGGIQGTENRETKLNRYPKVPGIFLWFSAILPYTKLKGGSYTKLNEDPIGRHGGLNTSSFR
mgnify:CR=1 FL=1